MAESRLPRTGTPFYSTGSDTQLSRADWNEFAQSREDTTALYAQGLRAARPAAGKTGRHYWSTDLKTLDYDDGTAWTAVTGSLVDWTMTVRSGSYDWLLTQQRGTWRRTGNTVEAMASSSQNANPPGGAVGQLTFSLPPGITAPDGAWLGLADVGLPGGGVAYHGYVLAAGGLGRLHSFDAPAVVAPANGYTLTVDLRFTAS